MKDGEERKEKKRNDAEKRKETVSLDKTCLPRNRHDEILGGKHCVDVDFREIISRRFENLRSITVLSPQPMACTAQCSQLHAGDGDASFSRADICRLDVAVANEKREEQEDAACNWIRKMIIWGRILEAVVS